MVEGSSTTGRIALTGQAVGVRIGLTWAAAAIVPAVPAACLLP
jgi:hypothetical protein